jgi:hypothetical protein
VIGSPTAGRHQSTATHPRGSQIGGRRRTGRLPTTIQCTALQSTTAASRSEVSGADASGSPLRFASQGQVVVEVPFDGHLRPGGVIDQTSQMSETTRRRFIEIAAALAKHFPTRDDRSRERY